MKMKIRFIYHHGKDSLVGRGIVAWTWILALARLDFKSLKNNFSHVEIWFPDESGEFGCAIHLPNNKLLIGTGTNESCSCAIDPLRCVAEHH